MAQNRQQKLTPEQEQNIRQWQQSLIDRRTRDLLRLVKMPEFLRFVGNWTKFCKTNEAIIGEQTNNISFREGVRHVGEKMLETIALVDIEAKFEVERLQNHDNQTRDRIVNRGERFEPGETVVNIK